MDRPDPGFDAAVAHRDGPALVVGAAGSGRTEAIVRRFVALNASGVAAERIAILTHSPGAAADLRARIGTAITTPYEELWVGTFPEVCERLLRDYSLEAGVDPFFEVVAPADRLAILLDRLDELPLRRHQIRGNPAGLLARLLERLDLLKTEGIGPAELRDHARAAERGATQRTEREAATRELEFAELFERHDAILLDRGAIDEPELILELGRLLARRPDISETIERRFPQLMVDELEDASRARTALLRSLAPKGNLLATCDPDQGIHAFGFAGEAAAARFLEDRPEAAVYRLGRSRRVAADLRMRLSAVVPEAYREIAPALATPTPPAARGAAQDPTEGIELWECENDRAQAQAVAREIEHLLAGGRSTPGAVCVLTGSTGREGRLLAAALEERNVPFRTAGSAAFFGRPEVRDAIAWLRALADPHDSAAVVRALTRPPVELRSVDLARCTTIARRRKLDMISAVEAALESPQLPPPSRDRIRAFLKLYKAAARAQDALRADVFVRRLIERVGFRRHGLFGASPETAERLVNLAELAELAAAWTRRRPDGSTREFVSYLSTVADAGQRFSRPLLAAPVDAVLIAEPGQVKGMEFERVYLVGLDAGALLGGAERAEWIEPDLLEGSPRLEPGAAAGALRARRACIAISRARDSVVLAYPERTGSAGGPPSPVYEIATSLGIEPRRHVEELFGPAEGLHSTYRMVRDEVLEASWRAGAALSEMRLDTAEDVNRAVARFLELLKLGALIQRPGGESEREAVAALNELLGRVATPEQRVELERSALDSYVLEEGRERVRRREQLGRGSEPGLEAFLPKRGGGLGLSASDLDLYRTCPLKYKFARVFAIPQEPTINQRFGILVHNVLERYHSEELRGFGWRRRRRLRWTQSAARPVRGRLAASGLRLQRRRDAVPRPGRGGAGPLLRAPQRRRREAGSGWSGPSPSRSGTTAVRGRIDRVDRHPDGQLRADRLQDRGAASRRGSR